MTSQLCFLSLRHFAVQFRRNYTIKLEKCKNALQEEAVRERLHSQTQLTHTK